METLKQKTSVARLPYNCYSHVHRFMRSFLSEFESQVAKCDFRNADNLSSLEKRFAEFKAMLDMHAKFEDEAYHPMLENKADKIFHEAEKQHRELDQQLELLAKRLNQIKASKTDLDKLMYGYEFYLDYTIFMTDYFKHLIFEERDIMSTLNNLYTLEELRQVSFDTLNKMTAQQFIDMVKHLYPYLNTYEKSVFLINLKDCDPIKFNEVWPDFSTLLDQNEINIISEELGLN